VLLKVSDQRPDRVIGYKNDVNGMQKGPIIASRDVAKVHSEKLNEGLARLGFAPTTSTETVNGKPRLAVSLVQLRYLPDQDGKARVRAKLKAEVMTSGSH